MQVLLAPRILTALEGSGFMGLGFEDFGCGSAIESCHHNTGVDD